MAEGAVVRISNGSHWFNSVKCTVYNHSLHSKEKVLTLCRLGLHLKVPGMLHLYRITIVCWWLSHDENVRVEYREGTDHFINWGTGVCGRCCKGERERGRLCSLSTAHSYTLVRSSFLSFSFLFLMFPSPVSIHMMQQLLDLSLLKEEERSSVLLGKCRSLLDRRRTGLGLLPGWSLFMQARAAVRKMLWMLFSDVKAEHSR